MTVTFASESQMVGVLIDLMAVGASPWNPARLATEFDYSGGRTDVIVLLEGGMVIALEAKLLRWREALQQAYRNTCFAHRSLVVLPWAAAERAAQHRAEFERRHVGLCAVMPDSVIVLIEPGFVEPLLPSLTSKARACLGEAAVA